MKAFVTFLLVFFVSCSFAQNVKMGSNPNKNYDLHLVMKGETVYSISKKFNTTVEELLKINPSIVNNNLKEGDMIRVPVSKSSLGETSSASGEHREQPVFHEVMQGETAYSISKKYNTDVPTILMWNNLKEPSIKIGQKIIVGYETPNLNVMGPLPADEKKKLDQESSNAKSSTDESSSNLKSISKKGIAAWSNSTYDDGQFYALHASAPKGTEVEVKNLMNNKTVTVKVIGKLPATAENENVVIRISQSAARQLNALDERFLVEIDYSAEEDVSGTETN